MIVLIQIKLTATVYSFDSGQASLNSEMSEKEVFIRLIVEVERLSGEMLERGFFLLTHKRIHVVFTRDM